MTFTAAGKRVWSPKGRPKPLARHNGYSHAEGGVATSYSAFGTFGARLNSFVLTALLFAGVLIVPEVSVAQVTAPGTTIRNVGTVAYQAPGGQQIKAGAIIIRQRGTKVHPGLNVKKGNDDTLFATSTGTIKFHQMRGRRVVSVVSE